MDGYIPLLVMLKFSDHGCGCSDAVYSPSRKIFSVDDQIKLRRII